MACGSRKGQGYHKRLLSQTKQTRLGQVSLLHCQLYQSSQGEIQSNLWKTPLPTPPFFPGSVPISLPSLQWLEDREWGLQSVNHTLSLPLLPPQGKDSLHSSRAPAWDPYHGVQSFRNRALQCGFTNPASKPAAVQAPLSMHLQIHPRPAPAQVSHGIRASFRLPLGFSMGCRWVSAPSLTSTGCSKTACCLSIGCKAVSPLSPPCCLHSCFSGLFPLLSLATVAVVQ